MGAARPDVQAVPRRACGAAPDALVLEGDAGGEGEQGWLLARCAHPPSASLRHLRQATASTLFVILFCELVEIRTTDEMLSPRALNMRWCVSWPLCAGLRPFLSAAFNPQSLR